uniref:Uncharacterized protein n=1 Tax=Mycena chlorophos TaxID=658473 RepID=A0ABQ0L1V5_MYCCL|nr:predicted protein [Mycena chlorophos]
MLEDRGARKNHTNTAALLSVPRYADAMHLSDTDDSADEANDDTGSRPTRKSVIVKSSAAWRRQLSEWRHEMQELNDADSDADEPTAAASTGRRRRADRGFTATLSALFAGKAAKPIRLEQDAEARKRRRAALTNEGRMMELLQAENSDEEPDAGAQEGSGDEYHP